MRRFSVLAALVLAVRATSASAQPQPPRWTGAVDLTIGGSDADENATFGRISGLATDRTGRIVVADRQDNQLKVFAPTGAFVSRIGRDGSGPLEFSRLAGVTFAPNGLLWTRDEGNARMLGIDISSKLPKVLRTVATPQMMNGSHVAITFNPDGSIVDEASFYDKATDSFRPLRLRRSLAGLVARTETLTVPAGANDGVKKVSQVQKDANGRETGIAQYYVWQPHGPQWLRAYGPGGTRAEVVTSRYEVVIYDENGKVLRTLTRTVPPVPLSARERQRADSSLSANKQKVPFGVPSNKAPIIGLKFSADGSVWVERAVEDGKVREADVFDRTGRLIAVASWPRTIEITTDYRAVISGATVTALSTDASEIERIVRLRFR